MLRLRLSNAAGSLLLLFLFSFIMMSCKHEKMKNPKTVKLTNKEIQKWVDKKFITPGDTTVVIRIRSVYGFPGTVYRVYAAVENKDGSLIETSELELGMENDTTVNIDPFAFAGNMEASLKDWKLWKTTNGNIGLDPSFSYIRLIPAVTNYEGLPLFYLQDYLVNNSGTATEVPHYNKDFMIIKGLLPCPPCSYCKAPCPPPSTCNDSCEPIIIQSDSLTGGGGGAAAKMVKDTTRK